MRPHNIGRPGGKARAESFAVGACRWFGHIDRHGNAIGHTDISGGQTGSAGVARSVIWIRPSEMVCRVSASWAHGSGPSTPTKTSTGAGEPTPT